MSKKDEFDDASERLNKWIMDLSISGKEKCDGLQRVGALLKAFNNLVDGIKTGG